MSDIEIKRDESMVDGEVSVKINDLDALPFLGSPDEFTDNESDDGQNDELCDKPTNEQCDDKKYDAETLTRMRRYSQPNLHKFELMHEIAAAHGGKCLSNEYEGLNGKLKWVCSDKHTWYATARNVYRYKSWCPKCHVNIGEELVRATMMECFPGKMFERIRPEWLNGLELDGYNQELKLAFEYQGIQHFKHVPHFHREAGQFESQLARDSKKREYCTRMEIKLLEISYKIKSDNIRAAVRQMLSDMGFTIADIITMSNDKFYDMCRTNSRHKEERLNLAREIANVKGGECLSTRYIGNAIKMKFRCMNGHEFEASLQDINQPRSRGARFCPTCGGTQKKSDDDIRTCVEAVGYRLIGDIKREADISGKKRSRLMVQCPMNHVPYPVNMDNLLNKDGSLKKACSVCQHAAHGIELRFDIDTWSRENGIQIIGEYTRRDISYKWKCANDHVFEATFVTLKMRKHKCRICLINGIR